MGEREKEQRGETSTFRKVPPGTTDMHSSAFYDWLAKSTQALLRSTRPGRVHPKRRPVNAAPPHILRVDPAPLATLRIAPELVGLFGSNNCVDRGGGRRISGIVMRSAGGPAGGGGGGGGA